MVTMYSMKSIIFNSTIKVIWQRIHGFLIIIDTWQLLSSWMTALLSLLISQTQMNSASRWPWKKRLRIRWTTAPAERPLGTLQFSMSQKTPTGGMFSGPPLSGEPSKTIILKHTQVSWNLTIKINSVLLYVQHTLHKLKAEFQTPLTIFLASLSKVCWWHEHFAIRGGATAITNRDRDRSSHGNRNTWMRLVWLRHQTVHGLRNSENSNRTHKLNWQPQQKILCKGIKA